MRMSPTDIMDVTGATYTFLVNGQPPAANWTGLFTPGERIRLRFINSAAMTTFDVRIPGLALTIVQADGANVEPVACDEFRIGVAETYDVIVQPPDDRSYTIFAQAQDRSGYARATLATRSGLSGAIPPMDPPPLRGMADMGMGDMAGMDMTSASHDMSNMPGMAGTNDKTADMSGMNMPGMNHGPSSAANASGVDAAKLAGQPMVDNVAMMPMDRQSEAGTGLEKNGRRVLRYSQLAAVEAEDYPLEATRSI